MTDPGALNILAPPFARPLPTPTLGARTCEDSFPFLSPSPSLLLIGLLAYLAGSHSATTPATAQAPIRWKMQTAWPLGVFPDDAAKLLVATIEKTSGGRLKIEVSSAGAVVPPFEIRTR